ncbi:hypothetical protein BDR04DRAFT_1119223 [Suillus decipiens]|nr:hypothetical protein BDR04DRAFT_1119223 [Suillus decipiens]
MAVEAKCVPDDKPNLVVEKEEWCHRWSNLTLMSMEGKIEKCIMARQEKGTLQWAIKGMMKMGKMRLTLLRCVPSESDMDGDSDDGIVVHDMRWRVKGALSAGLLSSAVPILIKAYHALEERCPKGRAASSHGSKILDLLTDWEEAPSASQIPKAKPMVMMPSRKHKIAEVEEEDFDLVDSGLHRDDLMVASRLRGVHVKFCAIQGLMAEVTNELDMMHAHFNRKARG